MRSEPQSAADDLVNAFCEKLTYSTQAYSEDVCKSTVVFDLHASFAACEVVACCGMDPATATAEELDALDARVACVPCKLLMTWRKAVGVSLRILANAG